MLVYYIGALVGWVLLSCIIGFIGHPRHALWVFPCLNRPSFYPKLLAAHEVVESVIRVAYELAPYLGASIYSVSMFMFRRYCEARSRFVVWEYEIPVRYVRFGLPFFVSPASNALKYVLVMVGVFSKILGSTKSYKYYHRFYWRMMANKYTNAILVGLDLSMIYFLMLSRVLSDREKGRKSMLEKQAIRSPSLIVDEETEDPEYDETYIVDESYIQEDFEDEDAYIDDSEYWEDEEDIGDLGTEDEHQVVEARSGPVEILA